MYYYEVLARLGSYHGSDFLTYHSKDKLRPGNIVNVPVRKESVMGVIMEQVSKPEFATKPISSLVIEDVLPQASIKLINWLTDYYPAPLGTFAQQLLPASLNQTSRIKVAEQAAQTVVPLLPPLTNDQKMVLSKIRKSDKSTFLLHGDTGTGKTRVYIELTTTEIEQGRSVMVLTPEIGLTPQLVKGFESSFGAERIVLLHSALTPRERREAWLRTLQSPKPLIVIGPRSALFSPLKDIGLIIVDESHESAYKQEQAPYYQALRVASKLASIHGARLVTGSATPSVQDYYFAAVKGAPILRMQTPATQVEPSERQVHIVDLRDKSNLSRNPQLSNQLLDAIEQTLLRKEQALIFLNRRGTARLILCHHCGWQAHCPQCDLPLTYHADRHYFQCHTCGHNETARTNCPECGSTDIIFKSIGTKSLVETLRREFRGARIQRFDTDSKKHERLEQHFPAIVSGNIDILVGTQMIGKGLDLPQLALVGIVAADASLYFPDYTAEERTFQLLYQVIGRVGRGHRPGTAIIQTHTPDNPTLQAVVNKNWTAFYQQQLQQRQHFQFPPFCHLLKLSCSRTSSNAAKQAAEKLLNTLQHEHIKVALVGPSPSFYEKVGGRYQWQLIVKAKNRGELLKIIPLLPSGWHYDLDPSNLL